MQIIADQEWLAVLYVVATVLFILSLRGLEHESTAYLGTVYGMVGMALAVAGTARSDMVQADAYWILLAVLLPCSALAMLYAKSVEIDRLPELVGLFNAFGGLAAALEGIAIYLDRYAEYSIYSGLKLSSVDSSIQLLVAFASVIIGMMTFAGSIVAVMKLMPWESKFHVDTKPKTFPGRNALMVLLTLAMFGVCAAIFVIDYPYNCTYKQVGAATVELPNATTTGSAFTDLVCAEEADATTGTILMVLLAVIASVLAILNTLGISGSDMAVVIAVLNSGSGWGGVAAGFMVSNELLLVTGAFVGASGAILSYIMCQAMNLDILRVLGLKPPKMPKVRDPNSEEIILPDPTCINQDIAAQALRDANDIIISPGYGMAAAGAQVVVGQLAENLRRMGKRVRFAIHPVAGRLPGHMNILLAEAKVPYDIVMSMEEINEQFKECDLAIVVGAWDTVNPVAAEDPDSPVFGMPMCRVWEAKKCIVNKRSLPRQGASGGGFSGAENTLPHKENTDMLLGSAKDVFSELNATISAEVGKGSKMRTSSTRALGAGVVAEVSVEELRAMPTSKTIVVPCETEEDENRCAITVQSAIKLRKMGFNVVAEQGVGKRANISDLALSNAAVTVVTGFEDLYKQADITLKVNPPTVRGGKNELNMVPEGSTFIGFVGTLDRFETEAKPKTEAFKDLVMAKERNITLVGMQFLPRISRAQKSDALSTFGKLAGHRAVLEASVAYGRVMGGEITAAGKNPPAVVFVAGCGVAGLEAVAVSKKLGAMVRATDVRVDCVEQVASVGGEFVHPDEEALRMAKDEGGYAKPDFSEEGQRKSKKFYTEQCPQCDIMITTAALIGRPPPVLITDEMVASMKPGSVIVDIAKGNCTMTRPGEKYVTENGVTIVGYADYPSRMAAQASDFYSSNLVNLIDDMCAIPEGNKNTFKEPKADGFWCNMEVTREQKDVSVESYGKGSYATGDDIMAGMVLTKGGQMDYPKPPPKSLSVAPQKKSLPPPPPAATSAGMSTVGKLFMSALGLGFAAVMAFVIAPKSPYFVGNVMIFILASVLGYCLVMGVKSSLHTPLMSMSNAISGIVILGGMMQIQGKYLDETSGNATQVLGAAAAGVSAINIAGGFAVTFRMLAMFKSSDDDDTKRP